MGKEKLGIPQGMERELFHHKKKASPTPKRPKRLKNNGIRTLPIFLGTGGIKVTPPGLFIEGQSTMKGFVYEKPQEFFIGMGGRLGVDAESWDGPGPNRDLYPVPPNGQ
jgi:hypothetical protein